MYLDWIVLNCKMGRGVVICKKQWIEYQWDWAYERCVLVSIVLYAVNILTIPSLGRGYLLGHL